MSGQCPGCGVALYTAHHPDCRVLAAFTDGVSDPDSISQSEWRQREFMAVSAFGSDPVNHPDHYQSASGLECIDAIRAALTPEEFRGYCKGAALKYIWREAKKGGNESLAKSVWYMNEAQK